MPPSQQHTVEDQMTPSAPPQNTAAIRDMLDSIKVTLGTLDQTIRTFNAESAKVSTVGASTQNIDIEIQTLSKQILAQERRQQRRVQEVKHMIKSLLKDQVAEELRTHIQERIKAELVAQAKSSVNEQILDHLPAHLPQLEDDLKKATVEVKHALLNSEARRVNSILRTDNLDDTLAVVLKPDGTKSDLYPVDLRSLFSYDLPMTEALLKDHDLFAQDDRERNLNLFMSHIGIHFRLVTVPAANDMWEGSELSSVY